MYIQSAKQDKVTPGRKRNIDASAPTTFNQVGFTALDIGTVRQNARRNLWFVDIQARHSPTGKRLKVYSIPDGRGALVPCRTREAAQYLKSLINAQMAQGCFNYNSFRRRTAIKLSEFAGVWFEKQTHLGVSSLKGYSSDCKNHILPKLGGLALDRIDARQLEYFMRELPPSLKPASKQHIRAVCMKMLGDAERWGYLDKTPQSPRMAGNDSVIAPEIDWLNAEEQVQVLEAIPERHRPIMQLMMMTGCRPSEARALRWQDVKWDRNEIMVCKILDYDDNEVPTKGKKILPVPMIGELKTILGGISAKGGPRLFINPDTGKGYTARALRYIWNKACDAALGRRVTLYHATRHSFATQLMNAGVGLGEVQRLLRHADPRVTKRYYELRHETLIESLDKVFGAAHARLAGLGGKSPALRQEKSGIRI